MLIDHANQKEKYTNLIESKSCLFLCEIESHVIFTPENYFFFYEEQSIQLLTECLL
jgi:hypothetical protein